MCLSFTKSLKWSHTHSHTCTHTHTQTHSPVQCCQQSLLTVYHGCGNSSSVMYEKKTLAKTSMRIWTVHTHRAPPPHNAVQDSSCSHCRALAAAKAVHKNAFAASLDCEEQQLIRDNYPVLHIAKQEAEFPFVFLQDQCYNILSCCAECGTGKLKKRSV